MRAAPASRRPSASPSPHRFLRQLFSWALLVGMAVLAAGCQPKGGETPEELFDMVRERVRRGAWGEVFELYHEDGKRRELESVRHGQNWLERNTLEGNEQVYRQFNYASKEEFMRATPLEAWINLHVTLKRSALDDARLGEHIRDPKHPNDVVVPWWDAYDTRWLMRVRREGGVWKLMDLGYGKS